METKAILFDFDGVLADSFEHLYALNKEAMAKIGKRLSKKRYRDFFMSNVHRGFQEFIKNDMAYNHFHELRCQNFGKYYSAVKLFPGIPNFIKKMSRGFILAVVSSGDYQWINKLFKNAKIKKYFHFIYASNNQSKERQVNLILKQLKISPPKAAMISDTCGDLVLAKRMGLKSIGVSWGFHSPKKLYLAGPEFIAKNSSQLYSYLLQKLR